MSYRPDEDPEAIAARLQQDRAEMSRVFRALRDRILPGEGGAESAAAGMAAAGADLWQSARDTTGRAAAKLAGGAGDSALRLAQTATAAAKANPVAAVVAGGGLAWLAWSGYQAVREKNAVPLPDWMADAEALQARATRLGERIDAAEAEGHLSPAEARESRDEVAEGCRQEMRRLIGQGLEGLEPKTRAAAIRAREEAWERHSGKGGMLGGVLNKGTLLALAGAGVTAYLARNGAGGGAAAQTQSFSGGARAASAADKAAEALAALKAARSGFSGEADRLSRLAAELSRSLGAAFDALDARSQAEARDRTEKDPG